MRLSGRRQADKGDAALVNVGCLGDPTGHRTIASDQVRDDRFAEWAMCKNRFDKDRSWHFREG